MDLLDLVYEVPLREKTTLYALKETVVCIKRQQLLLSNGCQPSKSSATSRKIPLRSRIARAVSSSSPLIAASQTVSEKKPTRGSRDIGDKIGTRDASIT
jgi:hypothetical protein